ncbi:unnamed protein product [Tuber aestivum]|uniref:Uncharacterized protein n=1 Tax=Tuber aestivum TaxID=59557 RepID=A0A292PQY4_9PEZI|nr:unnamed protein product [Tuber aestivum]
MRPRQEMALAEIILQERSYKIISSALLKLAFRALNPRSNSMPFFSRTGGIKEPDCQAKLTPPRSLWDALASLRGNKHRQGRSRPRILRTQPSPFNMWLTPEKWLICLHAVITSFFRATNTTCPWRARDKAGEPRRGSNAWLFVQGPFCPPPPSPLRAPYSFVLSQGTRSIPRGELNLETREDQNRRNHDVTPLPHDLSHACYIV